MNVKPVVKQYTKQSNEICLTERQFEIIYRISQGQMPKEIAFELELEGPTIYKHMQNIQHKTGARNLVQAYKILLKSSHYKGLLEC